MHYSNNKFSLKIVFSLSVVLFFATVKLIAQPLAVNAGSDQTICDGGSTTIGGSPTANFGTPGYSYSWAPAAGLSATNVSNPTASPTVTTTYTITVVDAFPTTVTDIVTITVNPLPNVNGTLSPTTCNGSTMAVMNFTSTPAGATFNWTNSAPSIGLSAAGTGSLPSFTAINAGTTPVVATISTTATLAGCTGPAFVYTITVNPSPTVNTTVTPFVCNGATVGGISFFSTPSGATFNWTNSNPAIGLAASGTGNMPSFTGTNPGSTTIGGNVSVIATLAGCSGPAYVFSPTIKPTPIATASPMIQTRCSGINSNFVLNSTVAGTSYSWTTTGSGVAGNTASSGTVISQGVTATGSSPGTANYFVTPLAAGCAGSVVSPVLTVNPIPTATATTSPLTRCSGDTVSFAVTSNVAGTTFNWTAAPTNVSGVSPLSGTGTSVFDTVTATTFSAGTVAYLFTPVAAGCTGSAVFPFVTVNPLPDVTPSPASYPPACSGDLVVVAFSSSLGGVIFNWTSSEFNTSGSSLSGTGNITEFLTATTAGATTYTITPTAGGCNGTPVTYVINVNPNLSPTITDVSSICSNGTAFNYSAATTGGTWAGTGITNASLGTFDPAISGLGTFSITYSTPGPCVNIDTTMISVTNADLHGKVTYSGGDLNSGTNTAVLFNYLSSYTSFDSIQVSNIDASGYYHFTSIPPGDYLIEVFADTLVYPLAVPTYYDSEFLWDTALVNTHGCSIDTADIYVIEGVVTVGPGMLSGQVTEGAGFVRLPGEPIPGIDVKLGKNPGSGMVTNTQTNPTGNYSFTNLPVNLPGEYYTIYIDIPGLQRDSVYNITVTATNFIFTQLDYEADSNSVYPTFPLATSIVSAVTENQLTVFPNPSNTSSTIEYTLTNSSFVKLEVVDILGKQLKSIVNTTQPAGNYKVTLAKLNAGIYFIRLNINNQTNTTRLVVTD